MAREYRLEAVPEGVAVESGGGDMTAAPSSCRYRAGRRLPSAPVPPSGTAPRPRRLPALPVVIMVVDGGAVGLARHLPHEAPHIAVGERLPEAEARGARQPVHGRPLVGMGELVDVEGVLVEDPVLLSQVIPGAGEGGAVDLLAVLSLVAGRRSGRRRSTGPGSRAPRWQDQARLLHPGSVRFRRGRRCFRCRERFACKWVFYQGLGAPPGDRVACRFGNCCRLRGRCGGREFRGTLRA